MTRWATVPAKVVLAAADICDGHTILKPEAFLKLGVPKAIVKGHTRTIKSDLSDPKYTIFDKNGKPVKSMEGVYGLDVLADIVRQYRLEYREFFGRGTQAEEYKRVIKGYLVAYMAAYLDTQKKKKAKA